MIKKKVYTQWDQMQKYSSYTEKIKVGLIEICSLI